jgi:hypothetical protein
MEWFTWIPEAGWTHPRRCALHSPRIHRTPTCVEPEDPATAVQQHRPSADEGLLRAAFRDLHGARLHGFALLVTLGDQRLAERLASEALADGVRRANSLRHPERAAAWLRRHVVRALGRPRRRRGAGPSEESRRRALAALGVDGSAYAALQGLDQAHRVTLVAGWIESLDPRDLEGVIRFAPAVLARMLASARSQFLDAYLRSAPEIPPIGKTVAELGPLGRRVRAVAEQTMGPVRSLA